MNYGAFIDDLPLVLGTEKLLMFQRKINRSEITETYMTGGKLAEWYREIRLGGREQVFQVFVEHEKLMPYTYAAWTGGGWGGIPGHIPQIDDACFVSNANDNFLQLREDGWYLVVFNWRDDTSGEVATVKDFYVYCLTDRAAQTDRYGLNIYRPDGSLLYHSGWDLMRVRHRPTVAELGGIPAPFRIDATWHRQEDQGQLLMYDFLSESAGVYVGENKLVSIGFCTSVEYRGRDSRVNDRGRAYFAPVLHQGRVRLSMCHAYTGINLPRNFYHFDTELVVSNPMGYNEIVVIDKPAV